MTWDEFQRRVRILALDHPPMSMHRVSGAPPVLGNRGVLVPNQPDHLLQEKFRGKKFVWIHPVGVVIENGTQGMTYDDLAAGRPVYCTGVLMGNHIVIDTSTPFTMNRRHVQKFFVDMVRQSAGHLSGPQRDAMVDRIWRMPVTNEARNSRMSTVQEEFETSGHLFRGVGPLLPRPGALRPLILISGISETGRAISKTTIERGRARVVPEVDVIRCQSCDATFGTHLPKTNCGQCGNVFCPPCASFQKIVGYPAGEKNETPNLKLVNVCKACATRRFAF